MSSERAFIVRVSPQEDGAGALIADIRSAEQRIGKALPGDRLDVIRYEALSSRLEDVARRRMMHADAVVVEIAPVDREGGAIREPSSLDEGSSAALQASAWSEAGDVAIEIRATLGRGPTAPPPTVGTEVADPAAVWDATDDAGRPLFGTRAVAERFREQLRAAVDGVEGASMLPSGVSNRVLTDALREFVGHQDGPRVDVPVQYRDGSTGPDFPMRCLRLGDAPPTDWRTYHFAMLSIRHTEMDVEVDGAWLRNTDVSRPRPAGDTDRIVFELTATQLAKLCASEPVLLYLYQTGLDTAVVGFYRAVAQQLMRAPGSLAVIPMYFRRQPEGTARHTVAGYEQQSTFEEGEPWVVQTRE